MAFQSTLPHGERLRPFPASPALWLFQSTLPHGERRCESCARLPLCHFQSTLPHGERLQKRHKHYMSTGFQSTLPHGERRFDAKAGFMDFLLSIHAPTRGATGAPCADRLVQKTFQSTLPHGERQISSFGFDLELTFNPRSHTGSDEIERIKSLWATLSIHAPTRGATAVNIVYRTLCAFQSTLPHGERRK